MRKVSWVYIACEGWFFGASKKQGTSLRMPLASCRPTRLCAGASYAHDVLAAARTCDGVRCCRCFVRPG